MDYKAARERYEQRLKVELETVKRTRKMIRKLKNLEDLEQQQLPLTTDD